MDGGGLIYEQSPNESALRQGEILSNIVQARLALASIASNVLSVDSVKHPFAIIVTQDCDLDWDYKARKESGSEDKLIPNILFCEVIEARRLRGRQDINSTIWNSIKRNNHERYHFLQRIAPEQDAFGEGLPELGMDFKRYFTVPTEEVYERLKFKGKRRSRLVSPYMEHFCTRFHNFQSRIALPAEYLSEPSS